MQRPIFLMSFLFFNVSLITALPLEESSFDIYYLTPQNAFVTLPITYFLSNAYVTFSESLALR